MSGGGALEVLLRSVELDAPVDWSRRTHLHARFRDVRGTQPTEILWMPSPHSYTREDVVELHLPGSPPLLFAALEALLVRGARVAEPGEFTRRAFENGRIDLTRAEGVLELVNARSEAERRAGAALLFGGLSERVDELRELLATQLALFEASLDFDLGDAGHVPEDELAEGFRRALEGLDEALAFETRREPAGGEPRVVLCGAPNAGKSTLFNALSPPRDPALVSRKAGSTRDGKSALWNVGPGSVRLLDGPGFSGETLGLPGAVQELAAREREGADLLLFVVDSSAAELAREALASIPSGAPAILVWNQIDRAGARAEPQRDVGSRFLAQVACSALVGTGLEALRGAVTQVLFGGASVGSSQCPTGLSRELSARHRAALERSREELVGAQRGHARGEALDWVAAGLRGATEALDSVLGHTTPEGLLDRVFGRFCLGK